MSNQTRTDAHDLMVINGFNIGPGLYYSLKSVREVHKDEVLYASLRHGIGGLVDQIHDGQRQLESANYIIRRLQRPWYKRLFDTFF